MSNFKAVLFDYDDTLVDTFQARVKAAQKASEGFLDPTLDIERIMREWAGRPQAEIFRDLAAGDSQKAEALTASYVRWYWRETAREVRVFPGVLEMLEALKRRGLALALVTSKARLLQGEDGPYGVVIEMQRLGMDGIFDVVVGWPDVKESKPAPAPLLYALEKLGMQPRDAVMVGDSHIDVTAARRAGVTAVGAAWGTVARHLLEQAGPDYIIGQPAELVPIVENHRGVGQG